MDARGLLGTLRAAGFTTLLAGDGLRISPSARLTPELREQIRSLRDDLVRLLEDDRLNQGKGGLRQAIDRCCEARGDAELHRLAIVEECSQLPPDERNQWRDYFESEAHRWRDRLEKHMSGKGPPANGLLLQADSRTEARETQ